MRELPDSGEKGAVDLPAAEPEVTPGGRSEEFYKDFAARFSDPEARAALVARAAENLRQMELARRPESQPGKPKTVTRIIRAQNALRSRRF